MLRGEYRAHFTSAGCTLGADGVAAKIGRGDGVKEGAHVGSSEDTAIGTGAMKRNGVVGGSSAQATVTTTAASMGASNDRFQVTDAATLKPDRQLRAKSGYEWSADCSAWRGAAGSMDQAATAR